MKTVTLAALLGTLMASPALAQERPVDPYVQSDANAGTSPVTHPGVLAAFKGPEGIGRIVDRMIAQSTTDPRTAEIFKATDLTRLRRTLVEQLGYILGAGNAYTGRDMKTAHKDQGINQSEFNALVEHLQHAMDAEGVPFADQNRLLAKLAPMQRDVVTR